MKIYISGKISGLSKKEYEDNFYNATLVVFRANDVWLSDIINPLNIKRWFKSENWFYMMIGCIIALRKCTHIAMQKNWTDSRGAVIEYYLAKFIYKQKIIWL